MAPDIISNISSNLGMGKQYLIMILFITLLSTHIRHDPSFFSVNNVGTAHGLHTFSNENIVYQFIDLPLELSLLG